jgi:predicted transcriptional regulator
MPRLTITLTPETHRALKETAARTNRSIRSLVEESLDAYGIKTLSKAASLVRRAREQSQLTEAEALRLALAETRAQRKR